MNKQELIVYHRGDFIPKSEAKVPATSRAVGYGEGVFDTLSISDGKVFAPQKHIYRLNEATNLLGATHHILSFDEFLIILKKLIKLNKWYSGDARVRIHCGVLNDIGSTKSTKEFFCTIKLSPLVISNSPLKLTISDICQSPVNSTPGGFKWSQYLSNIFVLEKAKSLGFDDAIMLTQDGIVSETTIANIFWAKGSRIFTPTESTGILPGIMRNTIMEIAKKRNYKLEVGIFKINELMESDAVFISNSIKKIALVGQVDIRYFPHQNILIDSLSKELELHIKKNAFKI